MKHIIHLVWFDSVAAKWPLAGWVCLLVAEAAAFVFGAVRLDGPTKNYVFVFGAPIAIRAACAGLIIAQCVQRDPIVGNEGFWRSRPVTRTTLLAAKSVFVLLWCVAVPAGVTALTLGLLDVDAASVWASALTVARVQCLIGFVAMACAAMTPSLVKFVAYTLVAVGSTTPVGVSLGNRASRLWPGLGLKLPDPLHAALALLVVACFFAVVAQHYLISNRRRSWVLLVAMLLISNALPLMLFRFTSAGPVLTPELEQRAGIAGMSVAVDPTSVHMKVTSGGSARKRSRVSFEFALPGGPANVLFDPHQFEFSDGTKTLQVIGYLHVENGPELTFDPGEPGRESEETPKLTAAAIDSALGTPATVPVPLPPMWAPGSVILHELVVAKLQQHDPQGAGITGTVRGWSCRLQVSGAAPLREGAHFRVPGGVIRIHRIRRESGSLSIGVQHVMGLDDSGLIESRPWVSWRLVALRNAAQHQSIVTMTRANGPVAIILFGPRGPDSRWYEEKFEMADPAAAALLSDDGWLSGAEFVHLEARTIGLMTRPFRLDAALK